MATRYNDRDYDRGRQDYDRRSETDYRRFDYDRDYEGGERGYRGGREGYWGRGWENERDERSRYGSPIGGSGAERGYYDTSSGYSQRYNYPSGYRSGQKYGERNYDYDRERYGRGEDRGWWDRASDEVASWFGDEEAERRRHMDQQRQHRGRGPKGYRRSDERIKEDVNDRLSDDYYIDASDVEVQVANTEVTLTGTVWNRNDKRRAEDIADSVSGVTNVENRIRVKQHLGDYTSGTTTGSTMGTTASAAAAGSAAPRSKTSGD